MSVKFLGRLMLVCFLSTALLACSSNSEGPSVEWNDRFIFSYDEDNDTHYAGTLVDGDNDYWATLDDFMNAMIFNDESMSWERQWSILSATLNIILSNISNHFPIPHDRAIQGELPSVAAHLIQDEAEIIKPPVVILRNILQLRKNLQIDFRIAPVRSLDGKNIN